MSQCLSPHLKVEKSRVVIYGLYDPVTYELRYVGKTAISLKKRLVHHLCDKRRSYKTNWIRSLIKRGLRPSIRALRETTAEAWPQAEQSAIFYYRNLGCRLTNLNAGGRGNCVPDESVREKMRKAAIKREQRLRPFRIGRTTITSAGRVRLSESRKQSTVLFTVSDSEWRLLTTKEIALKYGIRYNTVNMYRWRYKPKRVKPVELERRCRLCKIVQIITAFPWNRKGRDRRWECKYCAPAYKAPYRKSQKLL